MKTKYLLTVALLALVGMGTSARATLVTANLNDLILGFRATGGTGAATNLEVNLGNVSQFYGVSGTFGLSALSAADLVATYGSDWNTRTDLVWGIVGTTGSAAGTTIGSNTLAASTLWATRSESTPGLQSTPWTQGASEFAQQGAANTISTLYSGAVGSLGGKTSTGNSTVSATIGTSSLGSWSNKEGTNASAFTFFNPKSQFENGTNGSLHVSDLYELQSVAGSASYLGSFALTSDGALSFSSTPSGAAAVPEPSTYAAILGAVTLGFVAFRRRAQRLAKA